MRPGGSWIRRRIDSAVADLPQPDSPTMPTVVEAGTRRLIPSTALSQRPSPPRKQVTRSRISSRGKDSMHEQHATPMARGQRTSGDGVPIARSAVLAVAAGPARAQDRVEHRLPGLPTGPPDPGGGEYPLDAALSQRWRPLVLDA